ncbi:hypothetical protein HN371_00455 [Candidatus Poribacteria bacterium]|jgi:hypothetical protein|nr:hypothetical protein [Candidatus Poribacteria bacterium]MBT7101162.1 hypothetical protein [Candidatus Poribacteria bacterium]
MRWLAVLTPLLSMLACAHAPALYSPDPLPALEHPDLPALPEPQPDECAATVPVVPGVRLSIVDDEGCATCYGMVLPAWRVFDLVRDEELELYYRERLVIERDERVADRMHADSAVREWEAAWKRERRQSDLMRVGLPVAGAAAFAVGLVIGIVVGGAAP